MPDPRQGVALWCRERTQDSAWSKPGRLADGTIAAWLRGVGPGPEGGGFIVDYYVDSGLFVLPTAVEHGDYTQIRRAGVIEPPVFLRAVNPDLFAE